MDLEEVNQVCRSGRGREDRHSRDYLEGGGGQTLDARKSATFETDESCWVLRQRC